MVAVETLEYILDPAQFMRAAYRTSWSVLWKVSLSAAGAALILIAAGRAELALILMLFAGSLPFLIARRRGAQGLASPLNSIRYVMRFNQETMEQISAGDRTSVIQYSDLSSVDDIPEGLRIWILKSGSWILVPRQAFASTTDFDRVCAFLISAGKMRPKSKSCFNLRTPRSKRDTA